MSLQLVLDIGSGATLPDGKACRRFVDAVKGSDKDVVLKAQLFTDIPPNKPLDHEVFDELFIYGLEQDVAVTASVFDSESLHFLLAHQELPFVKIACRPDLYHLGVAVPRSIPVYASYDVRTLEADSVPKHFDIRLACVPEYPAPYRDYSRWVRWSSLSDHTKGLELFEEMVWDIDELVVWEKHLCDSRDPANPDSGPFALQIHELDKIL